MGEEVRTDEQLLPRRPGAPPAGCRDRSTSLGLGTGSKGFFRPLQHCGAQVQGEWAGRPQVSELACTDIRLDQGERLFGS